MARLNHDGLGESINYGAGIVRAMAEPGYEGVIDEDLVEPGLLVARSGHPGTSNAAPKQYTPAFASRGHKLPPPHVQAAHRRQELIDASTGPRGYRDVEDRLRNEAADAAALKVKSHASAVNQAIMRSSSHGGHLGGGTFLARPADNLPWLFFGAR